MCDTHTTDERVGHRVTGFRHHMPMSTSNALYKLTKATDLEKKKCLYSFKQTCGWCGGHGTWTVTLNVTLSLSVSAFACARNHLD